MSDDKQPSQKPPEGPGPSIWDDADYIHIYSRADAIRDGILIDVTDLAREAGFTVAVALTQEAWTDCVAWSNATEDTNGDLTGQAETGRLWDVLWMTRCTIAWLGEEDRLGVTLYRVPSDGSTTTPQVVRLDAVTGPGDHGEQVITICMPHED